MILKGKQSGNSFERNIVSLCSGTTLLASSPLDIRKDTGALEWLRRMWSTGATKGGDSLCLTVWSCFTHRIKGCSEGREPQSSSILLWDSDSQGRADRGESLEACFGQSSSKEPMCCSCVLSQELTECASHVSLTSPQRREIFLCKIGNY